MVMAMLDKSDTLRTFNLGDSGFRVIRDFQILYASRGILLFSCVCVVLSCFVLFCFVLFYCSIYLYIIEQLYAPNKPYQIGTGCEDAPEKGTVEHMKLKAGDMFVFASDGTTSFPNYISSSSHSLVHVSASTY